MSLGKNTSVSLVASLLNQLTQIATVPLLTRFADPSEFGSFSVFAGVCGVIAAFSGLRYDGAICIAHTPRQAHLAFGLFCFLGVITSFWIGLIGVLLSFYVPSFGGFSVLHFALLSTAFIFFFTASKALIAWHTRCGDFLRLGLIQFSIASGASLMQLALIGLGLRPVLALCMGSICGLVLATIIGFWRIETGVRFGKWFSILPWLAVAKKYSMFPKFSLLYAVNTHFRERMVIALMGWGGGTSAAGSFALGQRLAGLPHTLLYSSLGSPLLSYARRSNRENVGKVSCTLINLTFSFLLPPCLYAAINARPILAMALGSKWSEMAPYFSGLVIVYVVIASTAFLDRLYELYGQQRASLRMDLGFSAVLFAFLIPVTWFGSGIAIMIVFAILYTLYELFWTYRTFVLNRLPTSQLFEVLRFASVTFLGSLTVSLLVPIVANNTVVQLGMFLITYATYLAMCWFYWGGRDQVRFLFLADKKHELGSTIAS